MAYLKFGGCSLLGASLFLLPVVYEGSGTVVLGIMVSKLSAQIGDKMAFFSVPIFVAGALVALIYNLPPKSVAQKLPWADRLIATHWIWSLLAITGGVAATLTLLDAGPDWVTGLDTGRTAFVNIGGLIFLIIGLGCLFLPFLTDYGLLEFVGTLFQSGFRKIFNLPGRATIDTLASWVGSSSIAVIVTGSQYERGYYTARESAVIATNFSVVSVPFVVVIAQVAGIGGQFFQLYLSMFVVCIVCALITPRLPPLSRLADEYYEPVGRQIHDGPQQGTSTFALALKNALEVAGSADNPLVSLKKGLFKMIDLFLMMMPAAMTIEFLTLVLHHHTPVFKVLSYPLIPLLTLFGIPEPAAAAPGVIIGLLDQFVPAIIASDISAPVTKFVLAGLSVTQLVFFAETVVLIMRSAIPITPLQLTAIFFIRTAIALPLLTLFANMVF